MSYVYIVPVYDQLFLNLSAIFFFTLREMFCWLEVKFKRFLVLIIFHWTYYSTQRCMIHLNNYIGDPYIHLCCGSGLRYRHYEQLAIVVYCTAAAVIVR